MGENIKMDFKEKTELEERTKKALDLARENMEQGFTSVATRYIFSAENHASKDEKDISKEVKEILAIKPKIKNYGL